MKLLDATFTVDQVMALNPCPEYSESRVRDLWDGSESLTLRQILALDIPPDGRIWFAIYCKAVPEGMLRQFACDCAERVLPIFESRFPDDDRPRKAIKAARSGGAADAAADDAARSAAAWSGAAGAAGAAARYAAADAWYAAADAAAAAAAAAARSAAGGGAAAAAERNWQMNRLLEILDETSTS